MQDKPWLRETRQDIIIKYSLFVVLPVTAAFYSLRRLNTKSSYLILFLVAILFSLAFTVESGKTDSLTIDSAYYREAFERFYDKNWDEYLNGLNLFFQGYNKDYYFETVAYAVSRVTSNYHFFFMVIGLVFGYFSLKSLRFLTSQSEFRFSIECLILTFVFLKIQIIEINGVRFWTAYWIAVYSLFQIHVNKNYRYYLLALVTPFFHGTYWVFLGVIAVARLTKRFDRFWVLVFYASFFVSVFAIELLQGVQQYLPPALARVVDVYTSEDMVGKTWSGYGWIPYTFSVAIKLYYNLIMLLFIRHSSMIKSNFKTKELYSVLLIWMAIFNIFMFIPSLGTRYIQFVFPMIAFIWLLNFAGKRYAYVLLMAPLVFFWDLVWLPARYLQVLEANALLSNPIFLIYKYLVT